MFDGEFLFGGRPGCELGGGLYRLGVRCDWLAIVLVGVV